MLCLLCFQALIRKQILAIESDATLDEAEKARRKQVGFPCCRKLFFNIFILFCGNQLKRQPSKSSFCNLTLMFLFKCMTSCVHTSPS